MVLTVKDGSIVAMTLQYTAMKIVTRKNMKGAGYDMKLLNKY